MDNTILFFIAVICGFIFSLLTINKSSRVTMKTAYILLLSIAGCVISLILASMLDVVIKDIRPSSFGARSKDQLAFAFLLYINIFLMVYFLPVMVALFSKKKDIK